MPSFNPFGPPKHAAALFEIRLENDLIVLRGSPDEASTQILRGVVVLCLPSALKIEDVHLRMTGQSRIGFWDEMQFTGSSSMRNKNEQTREFFTHRWPPFVGSEGTGSGSKYMTLPAGNYEWPFELLIPGSTPESVEGLPDVHAIYNLKATVVRGRLSYDLHAYKPLRIIRTLDPAALELSHAMTVENVWPNKVEYSLVIPQKAVIFGTSIQVEMTFTPLLKGLKIGNVKCNLIETHNWITTSTSAENHVKKTRDIANWSFEVNEQEHYHDMLNEMGQDGWLLKETLPLPKSLKLCMQDVEQERIKIRHKVKFIIALLNPDGHVSELRASLPVTIYISPNMPFDESGNLVDQTPNGNLLLDMGTQPPPTYRDHIFDQLYADIDNSGFRTPAPQSGMSTPFYNQSNPGSAENVSPSMDGIATTDISPDILLNRLQNLSRNNSFRRHNNVFTNGGSTPLQQSHGSSASLQNSYPRSVDRRQNSQPTSAPLSRRASEESDVAADNSVLPSGRQSPEHIDFSEMDLCRVPSYMTAVRAPARVMSTTDLQSLPNYEEAISAPPSPQRGLSTLATTPPAAHPETNLSNATQSLNPVARTGLAARSMDQYGSINSDESRRFHLLQTRGQAY